MTLKHALLISILFLPLASAIAPGATNLSTGFLMSRPYSSAELAEITATMRNTSGTLSFVNIVFTPLGRADPALFTNVSKASSDYTYAYLLLNRTTSDAELSELTLLGVTILGYHSINSLKIRAPTSALNAVITLPFVRWVGYKPLIAKIDAQTYGHLTNPDYVGKYQVFLYEDADELTIRAKINQTGLHIMGYSNFLYNYIVTGSSESLLELAAFDFVNYVEELKPVTPVLDASRMQIGQDYVVGDWGGSYDGYGVSIGFIDTGYKEVPDLPDLTECRADCTPTTDHGTHVACIAIGRGSISNRYRGMSPGVSTVYAAKTNLTDGYDFENNVVWMGNRTSPPQIVSASMTADGYCTGTDAISVMFDKNAFDKNQTIVLASGNIGYLGARSIMLPGCAKNAITVGALLDYGNTTLGQMWGDSGQGPTWDNRTKPDVVAPGSVIISCSANGPPWGYSDNSGTSMATPHVSGAIAALMENSSTLMSNPGVVKAMILATALPINGSFSTISNISGHGKVSIYPTHYSINESGGWITGYDTIYINATSDAYTDLYVPSDTKRLAIILTWIEPEADLGSARAMLNDIDLYVDVGVNETACTAGEFRSISKNDTVEYVVIDNPTVTGTTYRLKACPISFTNSSATQKVAMAYHVVRGDPRPSLQLTLTSNTSDVLPGAPFEVTLDAVPSAYISSNVFAELLPPAGVTILGMRTFREDAPGTAIAWAAGNASIVLGDILYDNSRNVTWIVNGTVGNKTMVAYSNSDNSGINSTSLLVAVNTRPYFTNCPNNSILQDSSGSGVSLDLWGCANDAEDAASEMTYSIVLQSNDSLINCFVSENRNVTCDDPAPGQFGDNNITVIVTDTLGGYNSTVVSVAVNKTEYPMTLLPGWNFVAFPAIPINNAVENVMSQTNGAGIKVTTYNATKRAWNTSDLLVPQAFRQLRNMSVGEAYWVLAIQNKSFNATGTRPSSFYKQFTQGWNMLGWPYSSKNVTNALNPIAGYYSKVQGYNASTGKWLTYDSRIPPQFNTLANLTQGQGYWVLVTKNVSATFSA